MMGEQRSFSGNQIVPLDAGTPPGLLVSGSSFVLMPLSELAPLWVHPTRLRSVNQMLAETSDPSEVRLLFPQPSTRYGSRPACSPRLDA